MTSAKSKEARTGRERLLSAALRLSIRTRSVASLGLRELAREAGLHHTAFYRHFSSMDEVAVALVDPLTRSLRAELRAIRRGTAGDASKVIKASTERYFEYVRSHQDGFIFCVREIHGGVPALRKALHEMLESFGRDMEQDLRAIKMLPDLEDSSDNELTEITRLIAHHTFYAALDFLEAPPPQRKMIVARAITFIEWLIEGALSKRRARLLAQQKAHE